MSEPLWLDPAEMRASAAQLDAVATELTEILAELIAIRIREGDSWGGDKPGETFASTYVPAAKQSLEGFENLVAGLRTMGSGIRDTADLFEQQDNQGGVQIRAANPAQPNTTADGSAGPVDSVSAPATNHPTDPAGSAGQPWSSSAAGGGSDAPTAGAAVRSPAGEATTSAVSDHVPDTTSQPEQQQPGSGDNAAPDSGPGADTNGEPPPSAVPPSVPTSTVPPSGTPVPTAAGPGAPAAPTRAGAAPSQPSANSTPAVPVRAVQGNGAAAAPARTDSGPPRSGAATTPAPAENPVPPRVSPPRTHARPPGRPGQGDEEKNRTPAARGKQVSPPAGPQPDAEAMRILREMAAAHGLVVAGFETTGIAEQTAQEIADAVDTVLPEYSIPLHGIEISDDGPPSHVENRGVTPAAHSGHAPELWILLSRDSVADPGGFAGRAGITTEPADTAPEQRPMYTTMLLELGRVLDLAGNLRARAEAQRALITEYLRITGAQGDNLGRIVGGYRRWRAQLGDQCFDQQIFSPGRALAVAFATVELHGDSASAPAKVLHRLLVALAQTASPDSTPPASHHR
ncbi:hypothetical protein ACWCPQ_02785 [Nocardia sp. NPDC001965]